MTLYPNVNYDLLTTDVSQKTKMQLVYQCHVYSCEEDDLGLMVFNIVAGVLKIAFLMNR